MVEVCYQVIGEKILIMFMNTVIKERGYSVQRHSQQYFSYIVVVSFIAGGNRSTRRGLPTCRKSLTNLSHNIVSSTPPLRRVQTHNVSGDRH